MWFYPTTISQEIPKWMKKWSDNSNENVENGFQIVWTEKMNEQKNLLLQQKLGVSLTFLNVINNEKGIKEVTLKKVQQAIEKLSYVPDEYARGLKTNRKRMGKTVRD